MNESRSASASALRSRSGRSANSAAIAAGGFRWRSALCVSRRPAVARVRFSRMQVSTSKQRTPARGGVSHAVRRHGGQAKGVGHVEQGLVGGLAFAATMALHVDRHPLPAEGLDEACQAIGGECGRRGTPSVVAGQRLHARQRDEPLGQTLEHGQAKPALSLRHVGLHPRDQAAEVAVASLRLDQQRQCATAVERQLRADDRPQASRPRRLVEAGRTRDAVTVDERDRGVAKLRRALDEVFGQGRTAQERERGDGVQLDRHGRNEFRCFFAILNGADAPRQPRQFTIVSPGFRGAVAHGNERAARGSVAAVSPGRPSSAGARPPSAR